MKTEFNNKKKHKQTLTFLFHLFRWKIRMGINNLDTSKDDPNSVTMDILSARIHPTYSKTVSYFDVAVLTVKSVPSRSVSQVVLPQPQCNHNIV